MLERRVEAGFEAISFSRRVEPIPKEKKKKKQKAESVGDLPEKTRSEVHS